MHWPLAHINHLLRWAEGGHLRAQQVQQVAALAPLHPARADWLAAGERLCLWGGALLLALAVVFFFAYNWADLHHFAKLGIAVMALLACVVAALAAQPTGRVWQAALVSAAVCVGALLALIGQIYQTGADIWELFAAWCALMLPFVLLARAWPGWLLCLLVANVCVLRLWSIGGTLQWGWESDTSTPLTLLLALNGCCCVLAVRYQRWMLAHPSHYVERMAASLVVLWATVGAVLGILEIEAFVGYIPLFMLLAGSALWWYRTVRFDMVLLAVTLCCAVTIGGCLLARLLWNGRGGDAFANFLIMAAYVLFASGSALNWLRNLSRQHRQAVV